MHQQIGELVQQIGVERRQQCAQALGGRTIDCSAAPSW